MDRQDRPDWQERQRDRKERMQPHTIKFDHEAPGQKRRMGGTVGFMVLAAVVVMALGARNSNITNIMKNPTSGGSSTAASTAPAVSYATSAAPAPPLTTNGIDYLVEQMALGRWSLELSDLGEELAQQFRQQGDLWTADYLELLVAGKAPDEAPPELLAKICALPQEEARYRLALAGAYMDSLYRKESLAGAVTITAGGNVATPQSPQATLSGCLPIFANDTFTLLNSEGTLAQDAANGFFVGQVDVVNLANEFAQQDPGTAAALGSAGVRVVGENTMWVEKNGNITTAFLGYNLLREPPMAAAFATDIAAAKEKGAELIVVSLHWGESAGEKPTAYQQQTGREAIDAGATLVLGSHPNGVQGIEQYHNGTIVYSLGGLTDGILYRQSFLLDANAAVLPGDFTVIPMGSEKNGAPRPLFGSEAQSVTNVVLQRSLPLAGGIKELRRWSAG